MHTYLTQHTICFNLLSEHGIPPYQKLVAFLHMIRITTAILGTVCRDKATNLTGTLTHWHCDMGQKIMYLFQPKGLNPEDGQPLDKIQIGIDRLDGIAPENVEEVEIPFEILGTTISDKASGFSGMAVAFIRHLNGCFHVYIQPSGVLEKTKQPIKLHEFDLRACEGEKITEMTKSELKKSKIERPSPTGDRFEDFSLSKGPDFGG